MEREMTMVERVARALSVADGMHPEAALNDADEQPAWTLYVVMAKAAIEALREPTEAMVEAGDKASYDYLPRHIAVTAYKAMVEAALKEQEKAR